MSARAGRTGQATVELVLVLPVLLLLLAIAVDGSQIVRASSVAQAAASEAARYVASHPTVTDAQIDAYVRRAMPVGDGADIEVARSPLAARSVAMQVDGERFETSYAREEVEVTVGIEVSTILPLSSIGFPSHAAGTVLAERSASTVAADLNGR